MAEQEPNTPKPPTPEEVQQKKRPNGNAENRPISETTSLTDRDETTPLKESELRG